LLWAVVVVTAAVAEFCAEQTLTAAAAIISVAVNIFVNFILVVFLVCWWLNPGRMELISSRSETSYWKEFAQANYGSDYDLEIALSGVSAKIQPHKLFSLAKDALKRRVT
jgi:hypothetical protein